MSDLEQHRHGPPAWGIGSGRPHLIAAVLTLAAAEVGVAGRGA